MPWTLARLAPLLLISVGVCGCYQSHGREHGEPDAGRMPPTHDAGRDAAPMRDAFVAVPLPREPVRDPGPDGRPSDDPEAMEWEPVPDLDPDMPCCDPIGPPVDITVFPAGRVSLSGVAIEWNGDGWGVLYSDIEHYASFQELARDGTLIGNLREYSVRGLGARLVWSGGRFGAVVTSEGDGEQDRVFALLDRRGVVDAGWRDLPLSPGAVGARLARVEFMDRWFVVESHYSPVDVVELDARAEIVGTAQVSPWGSERSQIVALKSRAVVFWSDAAGISARTITPSVAALDTPTVHIAPGPPDLQARTSARLRDRAIVMGSAGVSGMGWFASYDPFTGDIAEHDFVLAGGSLRLHARGLDRPGLLALCEHYTTVDEQDGIQLHVLTPEGEHAGTPVIVSEGLTSDCAIGVHDDTIFIAWPVPHTNVVRVQGYALRRRD